MDTRTKEELLRDFESECGFRPVEQRGELFKVQLAMEQTIVLNEIGNIRHQLADVTGERARTLRLKLERMIRDARLFGFRSGEPA